jgi:4-hydroxy-tetrahydrodipicolinate synthase
LAKWKKQLEMQPIANHPTPNHSTIWLTGAVADLPTPFDDHDGVDFAAFERLCERQIEAGAKAIVVAETTGEASTLTLREHTAIVRSAVNTARGRVRIIAGAGSNATSHAIELTRLAEAAGADAILTVVPYYNKPMQTGLAAHFAAVADCTELPIILHDVPSRTVRGLADETIARLAESPQFIGLKDASGDATRPLRLKPLLRPEFRLLSGDDATALAFLLHGGDGCISVTSNVAPELCRELAVSCRHGQLQTALGIAERLAPLTAAFSRDTPAAPKYALSLLGLVSPRVRLPMVELADAEKAEIARAIAAIGDPADARKAGHRFRLELSQP